MNNGPQLGNGANWDLSLFLPWFTLAKVIELVTQSVHRDMMRRVHIFESV